MSGFAQGRLVEERKNWRKDHPVNFFARPKKKQDNSNDLMNWEAGIPGKAGTAWESGIYKLTMCFSEDYPVKAPLCKFTPAIFHPNVFTSGNICLDVLNANWRPSISIKQLLQSIQTLLSEPNADHITDQPEASRLYKSNRAEFDKRVRAQAKKHTPSPDDASEVVE